MRDKLGYHGLRIITHNVRRHTSHYLAELFQVWAVHHHAHVICLQETGIKNGAQAAQFQRDVQGLCLRFNLPLYQIFLHEAAQKGQGVACLVHPQIPVREIPLAVAGRFLALQLSWGGHNILMGNVYMPSGSGTNAKAQREFIQSTLYKFAERAPSFPHIILGDFNFTLDQHKDRNREGDQITSSEARTASIFLKWARAFSLVDIFREHRPNTAGYTFHRSGNASFPRPASRIDRIHASHSLSPHLTTCKPVPVPPHLSDHLPLRVTLWPKEPIGKGSGPTRLQIHSLRDHTAHEAVREVVQSLLCDVPMTPPDILAWWPQFKNTLFQAIKALVRKGTHARRTGSIALDAEAGPKTRIFLKRQCTSPKDALRHTRWQWVHDKERPNPLLTKLLSPPSVSTQIPRLKTPSGGNITSPASMASNLTAFFAQISSNPVVSESEQEDIITVFESNCTPLDQHSAERAGSLSLSDEEVQSAIKQSNPRTAPGPDGIPMEIWKWTRDLTSPILAQVFAAMGSDLQQPKGFVHGLLFPIHKGGDKADPAMYRPITVLNTDYRILAKVLANRWAPLLGKAIGPEQNAFLPGRQLGDMALAMQLIPHVLRETHKIPKPDKGVPPGALFVDFHKAYDTIDRLFLLRLMHAAKAPIPMLKWVALLLSNTTAQGIVNGYIGPSTQWEAGVRQGCPLSPLLYLFVAWALAIWMKNTQGVGIQFATTRITSLHYADDTVLYIDKCDQPTIYKILQALTRFGLASGQRINPTKSTILPIVGSFTHNLPPTILGIPVGPTAHTLGLTFSGSTTHGTLVVEWEKLYSKFHKRIQLIRKAGLSVFGRAFAINGYALSCVFYYTNFEDPPAWFSERVHQCITHLIDNNQVYSHEHPRPRVPAIPSSMLAGHPSKAYFGVTPWRSHITASRLKLCHRFLHCITAENPLSHVWIGHRGTNTDHSFRYHCDDHILRSTPHLQESPHWTLLLWTLIVRIQSGIRNVVAPPMWLLNPARTATTRLPPFWTGVISAQDSLPYRFAEHPMLQMEPGPWILSQPLWNNPLLQLELPFLSRAPHARQWANHAAIVSGDNGELKKATPLSTVGDLCLARHDPHPFTNRLAYSKIAFPPPISRFTRAIDRCFSHLPANWQAYIDTVDITTSNWCILDGLQSFTRSLTISSPATPLRVVIKPCKIGRLCSLLLPHVSTLSSRSISLVRAALTLDMCPTQESHVAQVSKSLQATCNDLWRLQWDNKWKEGWWRLINQAIPWAGGHDICPRTQPPCRCGHTFSWPPNSVAIERAELLRNHVLWTCPLTQSFVQWLQEGVHSTRLSPVNLWLGQAPSDNIEPNVWGAIVLGFAHAMLHAAPLFTRPEFPAVVPRLKQLFIEAVADFAFMHKFSWHDHHQPLLFGHPIMHSAHEASLNGLVLTLGVLPS